MATLYTEIITPAELSGFARAARDDIEAKQGTLARWLPNTSTNDIVVRTVVGSDGSGDIAEFRSFDTETPIGNGGEAERKIFEMIPLGKKERISEYNQLRARSGDATGLLLSSVEAATIRRVNGIIKRLEKARGQALETGGLSINENGMVQTSDFGRPAGNTVTAPILWDATGAKVLDNLQTWTSAYEDVNEDAAPGAFVTSKRVLGKILSDPAMQSLIRGKSSTIDAPLSPEALNAALESYSLPPIYTYDRKVNGQRVTSDNKVFILPEPVDPNTGSNALGATFYGPTLEAEESNYGLAAGDQPGIAVGTYKTNDPIGLWVHSNAVALPVLVNPVASMVATVLA